MGNSNPIPQSNGSNLSYRRVHQMSKCSILLTPLASFVLVLASACGVSPQGDETGDGNGSSTGSGSGSGSGSGQGGSCPDVTVPVIDLDNSSGPVVESFQYGHGLGDEMGLEEGNFNLRLYSATKDFRDPINGTPKNVDLKIDLSQQGDLWTCGACIWYYHTDGELYFASSGLLEVTSLWPGAEFGATLTNAVLKHMKVDADGRGSWAADGCTIKLPTETIKTKFSFTDQFSQPQLRVFPVPVN